jgi:hypothetical protein
MYVFFVFSFSIISDKRESYFKRNPGKNPPILLSVAKWFFYLGAGAYVCSICYFMIWQMLGHYETRDIYMTLFADVNIVIVIIKENPTFDFLKEIFDTTPERLPYAY